MSSTARGLVLIAVLALPAVGRAEVLPVVTSAFDFSIVRPAPLWRPTSRWLRFISGRRPEDTTLRFMRFRLGARFNAHSAEEPVFRNGLLTSSLSNALTRMFRLKLRF
jgi:hypothetical protein